MDRERELWERLEKLEARVAQLEARPQQTYHLGGAGSWAYPWGTQPELSKTVGAIGTNVSRETSPGANGSGEPKKAGGPFF